MKENLNGSQHQINLSNVFGEVSGHRTSDAHHLDKVELQFLSSLVSSNNLEDLSALPLSTYLTTTFIKKHEQKIQQVKSKDLIFWVMIQQLLQDQLNALNLRIDELVKLINDNLEKLNEIDDLIVESLDVLDEVKSALNNHDTGRYNDGSFKNEALRKYLIYQGLTQEEIKQTSTVELLQIMDIALRADTARLDELYLDRGALTAENEKLTRELETANKQKQQLEDLLEQHNTIEQSGLSAEEQSHKFNELYKTVDRPMIDRLDSLIGGNKEQLSEIVETRIGEEHQNKLGVLPDPFLNKL